MSIFIEGTRGSGKTKLAVAEIQKYLNDGLRVATNLDLYLENLSPNSTSVVTRLPDHPRACDLEALGNSYPEIDPDNPDTYDESKFGIIVIDELLTSFNSRSWNDPDRLAVVSWLVQSRKYGWRLWLLAQDADAVDKQLRESLLDELYSCRTGRNLFSSPVAGVLFRGLTAIFTLGRGLPKFHVCRVFQGNSKQNRNLAQVFFYRRTDLHTSYKTAQKFTKDIFANAKTGNVIDFRASYSMIPASHAAFPLRNDIQTKQPHEKNQSFIMRNLFPITGTALMFVMIWLYQLSKPSDTQQQPNQSSSPQQTQQLAPSQVTSPMYSGTRIDMPVPDFDDLHITCSVRETTFQRGRYCFELNGLPWDPELVGFTVRYMTPCRAALSIDGLTVFATCNPHRVPSEGLSYRDEQPSEA